MELPGRESKKEEEEYWLAKERKGDSRETPGASQSDMEGSRKVGHTERKKGKKPQSKT